MGMVDTLDIMELQHKFEEGIYYNNGEFGTTFVTTPRSAKLEIRLISVQRIWARDGISQTFNDPASEPIGDS